MSDSPATTKDTMRSFVGTIKALAQAERERDEARAALDRVRELHGHSVDPTECMECQDWTQSQYSGNYPCKTLEIIAALATPAPADAEDGGR